MAWQKGPLPKDTWGWGGVVPTGDDPQTGFYFTNFCGDHVELVAHEYVERTVPAAKVAWYDNSLALPPRE